MAWCGCGYIERRYLRKLYYEWEKLKEIKWSKVSILHSNWYMRIAVDCDKVCMHNVILRATTLKAMQKDILKNIINKSSWNSLKTFK